MREDLARVDVPTLVIHAESRTDLSREFRLIRHRVNEGLAKAPKAS